MILTYKYRIKDSSSRKALCALAQSVNDVWNYVNEVNRKNFRNFKQGGSRGFLSAFDISNLLSGSSKELGLHSQTIQAIAETYVICRKTAKKVYLSWRNKYRHLGWIPFKAAGIKLLENTVIYQNKTYRFYRDRQLPADAKIKTGSFNKDSRGRWYLNITFETAAFVSHSTPNSEIGIDLGVKDVMTLSDGTSFHRAGTTKQYEDQLATAQRANKKKQVRKIQSKIKNSRRDCYHKLTSQIAKQFAKIYIGNVKSQNIIDKELKNLTKGVYDASWYFIKNLLEYKAIKFGGLYKEVSEAYTTQDCSSCGARTGPKGIEDLGIREWICSSCGASHRRDINAAKNILRIGHYTPVMAADKTAA